MGGRFANVVTLLSMGSSRGVSWIGEINVAMQWRYSAWIANNGEIKQYYMDVNKKFGKLMGLHKLLVIIEFCVNHCHLSFYTTKLLLKNGLCLQL